jgi:tRNA-dihydrouridine synthase A
MNDVLSIAPMIQWTDRHYRYLMRQITHKTVLYTEMVSDDSLLYNSNNLEPFIGFTDVEQPLVLQLGGSDPQKMGEAAYLSQSFAQFQEINLNCGCPSNKAKKCCFGAKLMLQPTLVQQIWYEMKRKATSTDITVKCRLGVTGKESFEDLQLFIHSLKEVGINKVIIHARTCILNGLSPAQNRSIPPLHPELAHRLVHLFPDMKFILNGGIRSFEQAKAHLGWTSEGHGNFPAVHGIMIGREAYHNPFLFATADKEFFDYESTISSKTRGEILQSYVDYVMNFRESHSPDDAKTCTMIKPIHNFFHGNKQNHRFKQKFDLLTKNYSKLIDNGSKPFDELVYEAIEDTIPKEDLLAPLVEPPK